MVGKRLLVGALIGGAAVYFFDPEHGTLRRARLRARWEQYRGPLSEATASATTVAGAKLSQASVKVRGKARELQSRGRNGA